MPRRRAGNLVKILFVHNGIRMLKEKRLRRLGGFHELRIAEKQNKGRRCYIEKGLLQTVLQQPLFIFL